jgi:hypothetical protein
MMPMPRAVVGLDDEGLLVDAVFLVLAPDLGQQRVHVGRRHSPPWPRGVDLAAGGEQRVDQPGVDAQQLAEALAHFLVALEVPALAPHRPAGLQRRQQVLLVQVFQDARRAGGQVVVEQDGAGVEVLQAQPALAQRRLQRQLLAVGQRQVVLRLSSGSTEPRRTFSPAMPKISARRARLAR